MESVPTRRNLCGQIVHSLGRRILAGEVKPGELLPQEWTLCDEMGVSRTVIREALKSLAAKGLVESRPKRGTMVRSRRAWDFLDPEVLEWQTRADASGTCLLHLTELRQSIEPTAAALAAERCTQDDLNLITEAFDHMAAAVESVEEFLKADARFHIEILHATGNPFFSPVANVIGTALAASLRVTNRQPSDNELSVPVHHKVLKAIIARKPKQAEAAMQTLLDDAADRIRRAVALAMA